MALRGTSEEAGRLIGKAQQLQEDEAKLAQSSTWRRAKKTRQLTAEYTEFKNAVCILEVRLKELRKMQAEDVSVSAVSKAASAVVLGVVALFFSLAWVFELAFNVVASRVTKGERRYSLLNPLLTGLEDSGFELPAIILYTLLSLYLLVRG